MNSLKNKLSNLVVVSRRDTSIYTSLNNQHISIFNWVEKNQLKSFFNNKTSYIEFNLNVDLNRIENMLLKTKSFDEMLDVLNYLQVHIPKSKLSLISTDFSEENKTTIINYALNYIETIKLKLLQIQRKAIEIQKDKGTWNLYLTRYFLKGITPYKKQIINAPLVLYEVELVNENGKLILSKINNENCLNEKLIVFLQRDIGKQKKTISDFQVTNNIATIKNELEEIVEREILVSNKGEMNFISESSDQIANTYQDLYIEDRICLGIYEPSGGKLKEDLEIILNADSHLEIFNKNPLTSIEQISQAELHADPILQIDKLDLYQRYAVRASLADNTIIQGPPGTGKSEVISNIIANLLFFQKDVMMVSEKVAALDVLKKRLGFLNIFMLLMYDNDKNSFFDSIVNLSTYLGNSWINKKQTGNLDTFNNSIWANFNIIKTFKYNIVRLEEFLNFTDGGNNFKEFIEKLKDFGGENLIDEINKENVISKYEAKAKEFNVSIFEFFQIIKSFSEFIEKNQLNNKNVFAKFLEAAIELKNYFDKYSINLDDSIAIENIVKNAPTLNNYLNDKFTYKKILKDNPFKFYEDVNLFKNIKRECVGLINEKFFDNFNEYVKTVKPFLNIFDNAKLGSQKYIFDTYVKELKIIDKKPSSKMFYQQKLNKNDYIILNSLKKIDNLKFDEYSDFGFIVENQELFNPLAILYFFNNNIFDKKFFEFIKNKYYLLDFECYIFEKEFQLDAHKWDELNYLIKTKKVYETKFPEFTKNNIFQFMIDEYENISWKNFAKIIAEVCRLNLLKRLANLSSHDKQFIQKAINVASSKRKPPIYKYIEEYHLALKQLFPIWIARPEHISLFVPLRQNYFEYGIYDEASQMFLERAYPLLFRSNINIIAGDDKQLKPSSFFLARGDDEENDDYEIDDLDVQDSLLDRAQSTSWTQIMLQNHYRSDSKELIEFSSKFIYDGKLNYASKNITNIGSALEVINVNGYFDDGKNKKEAEKVIECLEKYVDKFKTILVITFNSTQASYINSQLMGNKINNKKIIDKYLNGKIDVINIENVQGNEADLVILSISYAKKDGESKLKANFGPIIQHGGKNRLNVAITRAKSKMIAIKSFSANEINETKNEDLEIFKKFIAFLDTYQKQDNSKIDIDLNINQFNNSFKDEVFRTIYKYVSEHGLKVLTNFEVGNKTIDIVIMDKNAKKVFVGIQLNEWEKKQTPIMMLESIESQKFLESRGYKMFRVFEHEWLKDKRSVLENIFKTLKKV